MRLVMVMVLAALVASPLSVGAQAEEYEAVETDTSDDAFLIIVTKKYERGELTGATVLIKHKESGQYAIPYVDAVEIDTLDQVIREHKAKLLRAQVGEQVEASEPDVVEAAPTPEPAPEEPALQLKLDDAGVGVTPTAEGFYIVEPTGEAASASRLRARAGKARAWLIATAVVTAVGVPLLAAGLTYDRRQPPSESEGFDLDFTGAGLAITGVVMLSLGVPGMVVSGATLGESKRKLRRLEQAHYGTPRRVQRDLAESRFVF